MNVEQGIYFLGWLEIMFLAFVPVVSPRSLPWWNWAKDYPTTFL